MEALEMAKPSQDLVKAAALAALTCLAGCGPESGFARDIALDGPYRLVAVDVVEDVSLCRSVNKDRHGDCVGDGLPGATVFQAGFNNKYVVVARHPFHENSINRSIYEYYYITRSDDEWNIVKPVPVHGPLNETDYAKEKTRLTLPDFSIVFHDLK
jgi:hypothetical protein